MEGGRAREPLELRCLQGGAQPAAGEFAPRPFGVYHRRNRGRGQ